METAITKYTILPLIGLQNQKEILLEGHIVKINSKLLVIKDKEKYWRNIIRVISSYMPGSIRDRKLNIRYNGQEYDVKTSKRGLMRLSLSLDKQEKVDHRDFEFFLLKKDQKLKIELPEPFMHCFYANSSHQLGVISDIDDTVLVTHTKNPVRKIRTLLTKNAHKRKIVSEMKDLYHHFSDRGYAFFYVSNSEANLYPMIRLFLEHQNLPLGPLFLKSFKKWKSLLRGKKHKDRGYHKKEKIRQLMETFPDMEFILIGDDSQQDPEIYSYFAKNYPDRIQHILIRKVKKKLTKLRLEGQEDLLDKHNIGITYFKNPSEVLNSTEKIVN